MADRSSNGLPYGHFGEAIYDPRRREWQFERESRLNLKFRLVEEPRLIIESQDAITLASSRPDRVSRTTHVRQIKSLVQSYPELQPASSLLPDLLRVSEAAEASSACHESTRGSLLSSGRISSESHQTGIEILAFASGPTASDLRLVQLRNHRRGWHDTRQAWISVPTTQGEGALWQGGGGPIQQVCFAKAIDRIDAFLAVRMITQTSIFRPVLRRDPEDSLSRFQVDPNPVFDIPISRTGGVPHSDVVFNPWRTKHLGIADQAGCWSVWSAERHATLPANQVCSGSVSDRPLDDHKIAYDGWARISWVRDPNTLLVCTRCQLALFDIKNDKPVRLVSIDYGTWLLDIALFPGHPYYLCLLTSTHINIHRTAYDGNGNTSLRRVLQLRHFRNDQDITLTLSFLTEREETMLLIHSTLDALVVASMLRLSEMGCVVVSDPMSLTLPMDPSSASGSKFISTMQLRLVYYGSRQANNRDNCLATDYQDRGVRFYSLFYLRKDLVLAQALYFAVPVPCLRRELTAPSWEKKLFTASTKGKKSSQAIDDEGREMGSLESQRLQPVSSYVVRRQQQAIPKTDPVWTVSYEIIARKIGDLHDRDTKPLGEILGGVEQMLRRQDVNGLLPLRTLNDMHQGEKIIDDVDELSSRLQIVASPEEHDDAPRQDSRAGDEGPGRVVLRTIKSPMFQNLHAAGEPTLSAFYDRMVEEWISTLSKEISGRVRVAKEQLLRRAAAEVTLATRVLRIEPVEEPPPPAEIQVDPEQRQWELPVRVATSSSASTTTAFFDASSRIQSQASGLPTPSASATPSTMTGSSYPSTIGASELTRLGKYTTFSKDSTSALPRPLRNVLSHWTVGADPSSYDWRATSRQVRSDHEAADDEMTEHDRARLRRRAERHIRRQRREAAASQSAQLASSQAPEVVSVSQPVPSRVLTTARGRSSRDGGPMTAAAGSSQSLGPGNAAAASQIEPGGFGGRPAKKKRKQGF